MKIIDKDILDITEGIIVHQVNCQYKMGAGLAKQIVNKYPQVYKEYMDYNYWDLGKTQFVKINPKLFICNLAGQKYYGRYKLFTDYDALKTGFISVNNFNKDLQIYLPYKIGCGLAGGDWEIVLKIIKETIPNAIICKKN